MQPAYENFSTADFLTDNAFVSHQLRPTSQSSRFWADWISQHPQRLREYQQAIDLVAAIQLGLDSYAKTRLPEQAVEQLLLRIQGTNARLPATVRPLHRLGWKKWAVAASLLLALGIGIGLWRQTTPRPSTYEGQLATLKHTFSEKINTTLQVQIIHLPDGSIVSLAAKSRLSYPADFGQQKRVVYLSGEATFEVTSNKAKPFLVHANEIMTRVVGTRFTVRAFEREDKVRIWVQSGQVSVSHNQSTSLSIGPEVMLLPNQQVVFNRETAQFDKMLVDSPSLVATPTRQRKAPAFVYNDTPILQVLQDLKEAYGIDILYDKEALANCQLNSSMVNESFEQKLTVVCATIGATYELVDGQVIIKGGSCQQP
ncbi:FecR family protein [Fibrella forsythiae]|uniref:FecR family protein n=1 Tax=Fibrella forsythiae TaxID=2817061 RepID=A0ABS3JS73_9BACT|nr:FecR family protein [Fibrella forsythiae]MBO0952856.1 FecR family protein [Fibrella forsythiae]